MTNENYTTSEAFINAYVRKQEEFTVATIRQKLESEVREALLKQVLIDREAEVSSLKAEIASLKQTLEQSLVGLEAVTNEREQLKHRLQQTSDSSAAALVDYKTLKENYDRVIKALDEANSKVIQMMKEQEERAPKKSKKA